VSLLELIELLLEDVIEDFEFRFLKKKRCEPTVCCSDGLLCEFEREGEPLRKRFFKERCFLSPLMLAGGKLSIILGNGKLLDADQAIGTLGCKSYQ